VKPIPILLGLAFFAGANFLSFQHLGAQQRDVTATVQFSSGQSVSVSDFSNSIGIQPRELVNVRLQIPPDLADQPITAQAIDGGGMTSIGSSIRIAEADGSITFAVLATNHPGRNSIVIRIGSTSVCLQFWVMDSANPKNNPSTLTAVSHS
jgi:hypothetical protein